MPQETLEWMLFSLLLLLLLLFPSTLLVAAGSEAESLSSGPPRREERSSKNIFDLTEFENAPKRTRSSEQIWQTET